jgi:DNA polymerase-1
MADFEFGTSPGGRPEPVCLVARELRSDRLMRIWRDDLPRQSPFPSGRDSVFVAYAASAELSCFLELGWALPELILDLWVENLAATNGHLRPHGHGMLAALASHGLASITKAEKTSMRDLVLRGGPWTATERIAILDYCQSDEDALEPLLERMLPGILARPAGLGQALHRGRYMAAVARMEHVGVPLDVPELDRLREHWPRIKRDLIREIDVDYHVYDGETFKESRFEAYLGRLGIPGARSDTGHLALDRQTFREASRTYPQVSPLRELRTSLSEMRLEKLAVGADGRNRVSLMPFVTRSGRNAPSNSKFIFGPSVWLRGLIKPEPGMSIAYIDWSAQEIAIAAALSGDQALLDAIESGDPYMRFAKLAGLAPDDATKQTHGHIRALCKTCLLGSNYGMGVHSLAQRTGTSLLVAEQTQRALARAFPVFWKWAEHQTDVGELLGELRTVYGWTMRVSSDTRPNTLRNFPMQGNGAEMLRLACALATERGINVCAPIHDALLIEASTETIGDAVASTRAAMSEAARAVLGGVDIATEASVVTWPDRYEDPRGEVMWDRVMKLLVAYERNPIVQLARAAPKPLRETVRKGSGDVRGLTGQIRCSGCGKWIRKRPDFDDWDAAERIYAGDEWQEHDCPANYGRALDLASMEEWEAWEAAEADGREL